MPSVPTIDLEEAERDPGVLGPLDQACRDHGFFLLSNHGIQSTIDAMWESSAWFFRQPRDYKRSVVRTDAIPLGYYDRELTKRKRDQKEVFDFMMTRSDGSDVNQWPGEQGSFRRDMENFHEACSTVSARVLKVVYEALVRDSSRSESLPVGDPRTSTARLNYYPVDDPLESDEQTNVVEIGDLALGHHTDPGILTLLLQDMVGGLQTHSLTEDWIDVPPQEGTIVVNLGDAMQVWTNDVYRAAIHRVVPMQGTARYSTPYFFNPVNDAVLEPLAPLMTSPAAYRSFTWREYIRGRVEDNYTDLGEDDIQIARFRI